MLHNAHNKNNDPNVIKIPAIALIPIPLSLLYVASSYVLILPAGYGTVDKLHTTVSLSISLFLSHADSLHAAS